MKKQIHHFLLCALPLAFGLSPSSRAQWLTHTPDTTQPPGYATTAVFSGVVSGPYSGTVKVQISNVSSGTVAGVIGLAPTPFTLVTQSFLNHPYPLDTGGTFDFLNVGYNDNLDTYTVTFDFTGLAQGFLPARTLITFLDVDIQEQATSIVATGANGPITSAWLGPVSAALPVFDYDFTDGADNIAPSLAAHEVYQGGGVYSLHGKTVNQTATFQGFITRQKIKTFSFTMSTLQPGPQGNGGYAVAILNGID